MDVGSYGLDLCCCVVLTVNSVALKFCIQKEGDCMVKNHRKAEKHIVVPDSFYISATKAKSALLTPRLGKGGLSEQPPLMASLRTKRLIQEQWILF